jgi:histidyl-tRNA synthetase
MGNAAYKRAAKIGRLGRIGYPVELASDDVKLKKSLETAAKLGTKYVLIIGEQELREDRFLLRNMTSGEQWPITEEEFRGIHRHRERLIEGTLTEENMKEKTE